MGPPRFASLLLILFAAGACVEDRSPTAPEQPPTAVAPTFATAGHRVVNSLADPGDGTCNAAQCTLREAINAAGSTEISFAPGLSGSITLARSGNGGGSLLIEKSVTIVGPGTRIVIQRRSTDPAFRIIRIGSGIDVALTNLTIRNGKTDGGGGGINNFGRLSLTDCIVVSDSAAFGGGIYNHGTLALTRSIISGNSRSGIRNCGMCRLTAVGSTIDENSGDGITNRGGVVALTNSTVARNLGVGINISQGAALLDHVRIVDNAGTGITVFGEAASVTLKHSTVARNSNPGFTGGGIANREGGTVRIRNSTIVGNSALQGGGIANQALGFGRLPASIELVNSTVSGNSATLGGGIYNVNHFEEAPATITVVNSTIARNTATQQGGGIELPVSTGSLILVNSLVAENHAPAGPDLFRAEGNRITARSSLIGDGSGSGVANADGNQVGNVSPNTSPIDAGIGPLADNGGPTRTHALLLGSPAIDAASTADCPATDQRGVSRPQGSACDIGSYERQ